MGRPAWKETGNPNVSVYVNHVLLFAPSMFSPQIRGPERLARVPAAV